MNENVKSNKQLVDELVRMKKSIASLSLRENKNETLFQIIPEVVYELDKDGKFVFISNGIRSFGYTTEELIGKNFKEIIHPGDYEKASRFFVLSKNGAKKTEDINTQKFFDERRASNRMTKNLIIRLARKEQDNLSKNYSFTEIFSAGMWNVENKEESTPIDYCNSNSGKMPDDILKKNKQFIGTIGIIRDISSQKKNGS